MVLLLYIKEGECNIKVDNLHSNMVLLLHHESQRSPQYKNVFTFQYGVTITFIIFRI